MSVANEGNAVKMDDLVERLRVGIIWGQSVQDILIDWMKERKQAADRIEELEELNQAMTKKVHKLTTLLDDQFGTPCEQIRHMQEVEELEAKLAKAMQVIEAYEEDEGYVPRRVVSLYEELTRQKDAQ